jgi:hypothetical protein
MSAPVLSYISEKGTLKKRVRNRTLEAEMKYVRTAKSCSTTDQLRNENIRNEWNIFPLYVVIIIITGKTALFEP